MTAVNIFEDKNGTFPHVLRHCNSPSQRNVGSPRRCVLLETEQDKNLILEIPTGDAVVL